MPKYCKRCQTELTPGNCCFTGMHNFSTGDRYMDNVCKECKRQLTKVRQVLHDAYPRPPPYTPCRCCGRVVKKLHLDHDHRTNEFRGYICQSCNHGIGHLGDNISGVRNALEYLQAQSGLQSGLF